MTRGEGLPENTFDSLGSHSSECADVGALFISEYIEGSSLNKAVEIYNATGHAVNLGTEGYALRIYFNGSSSASTIIPLTGTLADGDVYVIADDGASAAILAVADQTSHLNFFNGDDAVELAKGGKDDASSTPTAEALKIQLSKQSLAIELELELPAILTVQGLGDRVNASAGTHYEACSFETSDGRGIEVGFLWDSDRVDLVECFQLSGPDVEAAFGSNSASPGREPLYGMFDVNGMTIHIVGNHFKSKGGDEAIFGISSLEGEPFDRVTEAQRKLQAQVVRDFVNGIFAEDMHALVRPVRLTCPARPGSEVWQIEVFSTQWVGPPTAACSLTWGSFPPVDPEHAWLTTPDTPGELATDQPLDLLAGRLLSWGFAEAPDCPWDGLNTDGTANQCGVGAAREAVYEWQDRFDRRIFQVAMDTGLPARLLKGIFAQESQFWPGTFPNLAEYGLGGLHSEGTDTLLLWNLSFYEQLCPVVLAEDYYEYSYHEIGEEEQALLRGALAIQADVSCPTCPNGIDLDEAEQSVDLFGDLLLANCAQTGEIVRQTYRSAPGDVASYPDLWRFTLANYNAGPGCLFEAIDEVYFGRQDLNWTNVKQALLDLEACTGGVE